MILFFSIFSFLFGISAGSFINAVCLRMEKGESFTKGRSKCPFCAKMLGWKELIPVVSFLILKGKCLSCRKKISPRYLLVELAMGVVFLLVFLKQLSFYGGDIYNSTFLIHSLYLFAIFGILGAIVIYDIPNKIIPDGFSLSFISLALLGLITRLFIEPFSFIFFLDILAGPVLFLFFYILWHVSDGRWIGLGDGKLVLGMGLFLGFIGGISATALAFWVGALYALILLFIGKLLSYRKSKLSFSFKNLTMKSEIPFAPFLVLGTFLYFLFEWDVFSLAFILSI